MKEEHQKFYLMQFIARLDAIHCDNMTWCCAFCSDNLYAMVGSSSSNLEMILTSSCRFQMQMMTEHEIRDWWCTKVSHSQGDPKQGENKKNLYISIT